MRRKTGYLILLLLFLSIDTEKWKCCGGDLEENFWIDKIIGELLMWLNQLIFLLGLVTGKEIWSTPEV